MKGIVLKADMGIKTKQTKQATIFPFYTPVAEFAIYEENGQAVESGFKTYSEAEKRAIENGYKVVDSFNI